MKSSTRCLRMWLLCVLTAGGMLLGTAQSVDAGHIPCEAHLLYILQNSWNGGDREDAAEELARYGTPAAIPALAHAAAFDPRSDVRKEAGRAIQRIKARYGDFRPGPAVAPPPAPMSTFAPTPLPASFPTRPCEHGAPIYGSTPYHVSPGVGGGYPTAPASYPYSTGYYPSSPGYPSGLSAPSPTLSYPYTPGLPSTPSYPVTPGYPAGPYTPSYGFPSAPGFPSSPGYLPMGHSRAEPSFVSPPAAQRSVVAPPVAPRFEYRWDAARRTWIPVDVSAVGGR